MGCLTSRILNQVLAGGTPIYSQNWKEIRREDKTRPAIWLSVNKVFSEQCSRKTQRKARSKSVSASLFGAAIGLSAGIQ